MNKKLCNLLICARIKPQKFFLTHKKHEDKSLENIKNTEVFKIYDFYDK